MIRLRRHENKTYAEIAAILHRLPEAIKLRFEKLVAGRHRVTASRPGHVGQVIEVEVEKTELPEAFSRAATTSFKQLRFAAGERHGQPVGSIMRIEVSYVDGRLPPP